MSLRDLARGCRRLGGDSVGAVTSGVSDIDAAGHLGGKWGPISLEEQTIPLI